MVSSKCVSIAGRPASSSSMSSKDSIDFCIRKSFNHSCARPWCEERAEHPHKISGPLVSATIYILLVHLNAFTQVVLLSLSSLGIFVPTSPFHAHGSKPHSTWWTSLPFFSLSLSVLNRKAAAEIGALIPRYLSSHLCILSPSFPTAVNSVCKFE